MRNEATAQRLGYPPLRVLIVEDEAMISLLIENMVRELGHETAACVYSVGEALSVVDEKRRSIDVAMLDVNLGGRLVYPVAEALSEHRIPFAFLTGYGLVGVPARYAGALIMHKPFSEHDIAFALERLQSECFRRREGGA